MTNYKKEEIIKTEWNSNDESLKRINDHIRIIDFYASEAKKTVSVDNLKGWEAEIDRLWLDIKPKATPKELTRVNLLEKYRKKIGRIIKIEGYPYPEAKINIKNYYKRKKIIYMLDNTIRHIADRHGMLMADKQIADDEPENW